MQESDQTVNYKYNVLFNGFPEIQNTDSTSQYLISKPSTAQHQLRKTLKNIGGANPQTDSQAQNPPSFLKTGSSFNNSISARMRTDPGTSFQTPLGSAHGRRTEMNSQGSARNVKFFFGDSSGL